MTRKKTWLVLTIAVFGFLAVVLGPVAMQQFRPPPQRSLSGDSLAETTYREVQFRNESQAIDLAGMLLVPEGKGPFPAVVIIHGSGYQPPR